MTPTPKNSKDLELFTIGVYGSTEDDFFKKLQASNIDLFCDIRMRRAVRGSQYAFVNSQRLQKRLEEIRIPYLYLKELAPTKEIRQKQKDADAAQSVEKRKREELSPEFVEAYKLDKLSNFDTTAFVDSLGSKVRRIAFFCVEAAPTACHRSLVANKIAKDLDLNVTNI